jgi:hypothetical protein
MPNFTFMKKIFIISLVIVFAFLFSNNIIAQDKFHVGISMGQSTPISDFKSTEDIYQKSGYSETGFVLIFDGDYYLHNRFAVSARFNFGLTSMNESEVSNWLDSEMFDYLNENTDNNLYSIDYWQWSSPMLGIKYNYPIFINKLYIETAAFSGISIVPIPNQNLKIIDDINKQAIYSENISTNSISIPIMVDAAFRYKLNEELQIKITASYFQTNVKYDHFNYIVNENSNKIDEELKKTPVELPIQTLNFSIGLIYKL